MIVLLLWLYSNNNYFSYLSQEKNDEMDALPWHSQQRGFFQWLWF